MVTSNSSDVGLGSSAWVSVSGNRENLTLSSNHYWNRICDCVGACFCGSLAVASGGTGCSLRGCYLVACVWAMTGWFFLSCMIVVSAWMKASGVSTNAWASASGRSSTMAMSISPPSFLMRAGLPVCIRSRIATALFSQRLRSHSSMALCASDPGRCCSADISVLHLVGSLCFLRNGMLRVRP